MFDIPSIENFAAFTRAEDNKEQLSNHFVEQIEAQGFEHFAAFAMDNFDTPDTGFGHAAHLPANWANHYVEENYQSVDPTIKTALSERTPFLWEDCYRAIKGRGKLSQRQRAFFGEAKAIGLGNGIVAPLSGYRGSKVCISVSGELSEVGMPEKHAVHILAIYFVEALKRLSANGLEILAVPQLTTREMEILQFYAVGKSAWDISTILTISEWTVRFHLTNVRRKFGVSSMVHAVAIAIQNRQISI